MVEYERCCQEFIRPGNGLASVWRSIWTHFSMQKTWPYPFTVTTNYIFSSLHFFFINLVAFSESSFLPPVDSFWAASPLRAKESFKFVAFLAAVRLLVAFTSASYHNLWHFSLFFLFFVCIGRFEQRTTLIKKNSSPIHSGGIVSSPEIMRCGPWKTWRGMNK